MSTFTKSTGGNSSVLTLDSIKRVMQEFDANARENARLSMAGMAAGLFSPFGGLRVRESPLATKAVPVRQHVKRRCQSSAYHRRIQKKWSKRYGVKRESCAFVLDGGALGLGPVVVLHPEDARRLREHMEAGGGNGSFG